VAQKSLRFFCDKVMTTKITINKLKELVRHLTDVAPFKNQMATLNWKLFPNP
jgi:hypothetical protein